MLAALNDLDVFAADIGNAYLNSPCRDKIWTKCGTEFVSQQRCVMLIMRALYRLKSKGASCRAMIIETLGKYVLGYTSTATYKYVLIKN